MRAELKALRGYAPPRYPTWALVEREPEMLARAIPRRWQGSSRIAAALAAAVFGLGGGSALAGEATEKAAPTPSPSPKATPAATAQPTGRPPVAVAFALVEDTRVQMGVLGEPAPPVLLGEAAARQLINEELARAGLKLEADRETIPGVLQRRAYVRRYDRDQDREVMVLEETRDPPTDLVLDGWDAGRKVGYEYLARDELDAAGAVGTPWRSSDSSKAAEYLARKLNERGGERTVAVFWPPVVESAYLTPRSGPGNEERAREELRQQVRDFAQWLQAQGLLR
jgi:hypothetical protein